MITGVQIANTALTSDLIGTPYSKLDCQALVEVVLKEAGLNIINYRGSNHMWRELVYDRQETSNPDTVVFPGMLAFILKHDGGETKRGYHDTMGNATHVAIALGDGRVFESTVGGVQISSIRRFTHVARIIDVDYDDIAPGGSSTPTTSTAEKIDKIIEALMQIADELEELKKNADYD